MPRKCRRSLVVAVAAACAVVAPRAGRADEVGERTELEKLRLEAQELVKAADAKTTGQTAQYRKAGELYEGAFRRFCGGPARFIPDGDACAEIAYNAAHAFWAAHESAKAIGAYRMLIAHDDRQRTHSPLAAKAMYQLGGVYQAIALFDQAAEWFERFVATDPKAKEAAVAGSDAVILRLGLAQDDKAIKNAESFGKLYGSTKPAEHASLMFAIAAHHADREQWDRARAVIAGSMSMFDRAPLDIQVQVHALYGRAHAHGPTPAVAKDEYAKTRAFWKDPDAAEAAIRHAWPADDGWRKDRRLAKVLNAVGEALFAAAEDRRLAEVEPLGFPAYVGPAKTAPVQEHLKTKVRPWYEKKRTALQGVEGQLTKILDMKPAPPPRWVIAASATVGAMWGSLADDFRRVPIPDAWRNDRALYRAYWDAIEEMSGAIRTQYAKPAMKKCIDLSVKYQLQDPRTRQCETWLATHYKTEFHVLDELVPGLRRGTLPAAARPYSYEGDPLP